eukprot:SAG25_NODE_4879_length_737_cov_1.141066_2_plen_59_part_01
MPTSALPAAVDVSLGPPAGATAQSDGSWLLSTPDGTLRYTQRGDGTWRRAERLRAGGGG